MQKELRGEAKTQGSSISDISTRNPSYVEARIEIHRRMKAERLQRLQEVKRHLPEDKEGLDIKRLIAKVSSLLGDSSEDPKVIEYLEIEYYLNHPEIKNTDKFAEFIESTRSSTYGF